MNLLRTRATALAGFFLAFSVAFAPPVTAQVIRDSDGTTLRQIIVFGRHSVRATTTDAATLATYAVGTYPDFDVPKGYLTHHGALAELRLGSYFREYLLHEGLLTGRAKTDLAHAYFRANCIQRSNITAARFGEGLIPGVTIPVHSFALNTNDAVFDPIAAGFAKVDAARAVTDVEGQLGSGAALTSAFNAELSLIRSVVFDYPLGQQPPRPTPANKTDSTAAPFLLAASATPGYTGVVIGVGGLATAEDASDPFVMEYAAGMPLDQVAWGRLSMDALSQQTRLVNLDFAINMRSPYLARVQSSNAASHVLRSMEQAVIGDDVPGAFGDKSARTIVVISSDAYVAGLAGLLGLHWALPGYQPDFCPPGGALVFELRQSRRSRDLLVRAYYTAQTFDQLRNLTPLTLTEPPATMQLRIPTDREPGESLDVRFDVFQRVVRRAIDPDCVDDPSTELQPDVLTDVPLK